MKYKNRWFVKRVEDKGDFIFKFLKIFIFLCCFNIFKIVFCCVKFCGVGWILIYIDFLVRSFFRNGDERRFLGREFFGFVVIVVNKKKKDWLVI